MPILETTRLRLIPATMQSLQAELEQFHPARARDDVAGHRLAAALGVHVPDNWPPELYDRDPIEFTMRRLQQVPEDDGWWLHYFVQKATADEPETAVGCGGYKGGPSENGSVEIGYSVLSQFRRRGYAAEATRALVENAFNKPGVTSVTAETYPELLPSVGVLVKCGFVLTGPGSAERVIRYELTRYAWHHANPVRKQQHT
ncbi:MAG: GNAT family N-acetyltransferase [Gemmatimonadota bacterium]